MTDQHLPLGFLSGAPTGCNCGEVPADCSTCVTGINGWKCRPRDCTYCSHGINGFPCGGNNCSSCEFGINGWRCQPAAAVTLCTATPAGIFAQYSLEQQNNIGFVKLFVSSNARLTGIQLRTATGAEVAWQAWPETITDGPIFWLRKPALTMYSYPSVTASMAQFSPANGRRAPEFVIPVAQTGLSLWVQREGQVIYELASVFACQTSTNFQADILAA